MVYLGAKSSNNTLAKIWSLQGNTSEASIRLFNAFDLQKNGYNDVLLAREDSTIEWYCPNINNELEICWEK